MQSGISRHSCDVYLDLPVLGSVAMICPLHWVQWWYLTCFFLCFSISPETGAISVDQNIENTDGDEVHIEKFVQDVPTDQTVEGAGDCPLENVAQDMDLQVTGVDGGVPRLETVVADMCSEQEIFRWGMAIEERDCNWIHGLNLPVDYRLLYSHLLFLLVFQHLCRDGGHHRGPGDRDHWLGWGMHGEGCPGRSWWSACKGY